MSYLFLPDAIKVFKAFLENACDKMLDPEGPLTESHEPNPGSRRIDLEEMQAKIVYRAIKKGLRSGTEDYRTFIARTWETGLLAIRATACALACNYAYGVLSGPRSEGTKSKVYKALLKLFDTASDSCANREAAADTEAISRVKPSLDRAENQYTQEQMHMVAWAETQMRYVMPDDFLDLFTDYGDDGRSVETSVQDSVYTGNTQQAGSMLGFVYPQSDRQTQQIGYGLENWLDQTSPAPPSVASPTATNVSQYNPEGGIDRRPRDFTLPMHIADPDNSAGQSNYPPTSLAPTGQSYPNTSDDASNHGFFPFDNSHNRYDRRY